MVKTSMGLSNPGRLRVWPTGVRETSSLSDPPTKKNAKQDDQVRAAGVVNDDLVKRIFNVVGKIGIAKDAIRKVLDLESINSEADLSDVGRLTVLTGSFCSASDIRYSEQVTEALTKEFGDKDGYKLGKLHGKRLFPKGIFTGKLTQETYVKEAASYKVVEGNVGTTEGRPKDVAVVLGASGAGKSAFSLFGLPDLVFPGQKSLAVLIEADSVINRNARALEDPDQFGQELCKEMKNLISKRARSPWQPLKCPLLIVLDEAANSGPFTDVQNFRTIVSHLEELSEKSSFLVATGVGLDKVTQRINSLTEMKKYRMQDWDPEKFQLLIKKWNKKENERFAMDLVSSYDSLQSMITNARCAAFLVESMKAAIIRRETNSSTDLYWKTTVAGLLKDVSWMYIFTNGLARLSQEQCLKVVRGLFLTLEESLNEPDRAFFPQVPEDFNSKESEAWWGFLNINVETEDNETHFVNKNVSGSVSVSPALTLVAAAILDPEGLDPSSDWQGLEVIAAFGEVKHYLVYCKDKFDHGSSKLLLRSKVGYPFVRKKDQKKVPTEIEFPDVVASGMVVMLNGLFAPFADVIAPHRLVQVKHTTGETINIDLKIELGKLGCTQDEMYVMQQVYLHYLTRAWNREATLELPGACSNQKVPGQQIGLPMESSKVNWMGGYYPIDQLQSTPKPLAIPTLRAHRALSSSMEEPSTTSGSKMVWMLQGETKMGDSSLEIDPSTDLLCKEPVCAVIFTNASTINLQNGETITSINRDDVCRMGILLKKETNEGIMEEYKVKKKIQVRFLFCS